MFDSITLKYWLISIAIFLIIILMVNYVLVPIAVWVIGRIYRLHNTVCIKNKIFLPIKKSVNQININCKTRNEIPLKIKEYKNLKRLSIIMPLREIPNHIFEIYSLEELSINGMFLKHIPKNISKLIALKSLAIRGSGLKQIPSEIFELENLVHLDLSGNTLVELPKDILKLRKLMYLNIGELGNDYNENKRNIIVSLPKEVFLLPSLISLNISGNRIKTIPPEIENAKSLESLNVSNNQLESLPGKIVNTRINRLNIEENPNLILTGEQKSILDRRKKYVKMKSEIF